MLTVRLNIKESALDRVMKSLEAFTAEEVEIVNEDKYFLKNQNYLQEELTDLKKGNTKLISHKELENTLNDVIAKYEDPV
jgi:hypothetical protein